MLIESCQTAGACDCLVDGKLEQCYPQHTGHLAFFVGFEIHMALLSDSLTALPSLTLISYGFSLLV